MKFYLSRLTYLAGSLSVILAFGACSIGKHSQPNIDPIQDMMDQDAIKAQDYQPGGDGTKAASLLPPQGTVPQGYKPYPYHNNAEAAEKNLKNPYAGDESVEVLKNGEAKYNTYCIVCHGPQGKGDGLVAAKMLLKPPPLISDKVVGFNDGRIYHIITDGQGVMSSYAFQMVNEKDRWAVVKYVRSLQKLAKGK